MGENEKKWLFLPLLTLELYEDFNGNRIFLIK